MRGSVPVAGASLDEQWRVVDAFQAAARDGDFEALVAVLDLDVVLRSDAGPGRLSRRVQGAEAVAAQASMFSRGARDLTIRRALVNGAAGLVSTRKGQPFSVGAFTIRGGRITELDFLIDPDRLAWLDLTMLDR